MWPVMVPPCFVYFLLLHGRSFNNSPNETESPLLTPSSNELGMNNKIREHLSSGADTPLPNESPYLHMCICGSLCMVID